MLIRAFGLFWERDEVDWRPGPGSRFWLLGRVGSKVGSLRVADFREQQGLYVLYNDYGPSYVGRVTRGQLGERLRDHTEDGLRKKWTRFSWFGFLGVRRPGRDGICRLGYPITHNPGTPTTAIADIESVLIQTLGTAANVKGGRYPAGDRWEQVKQDQVTALLERLHR